MLGVQMQYNAACAMLCTVASAACTMLFMRLHLPEEQLSRAWIACLASKMQYNAACAMRGVASAACTMLFMRLHLPYLKNKSRVDRRLHTHPYALSEPILCRHGNTQPRTPIAVGWRPTSSRQAEMVLSTGVVYSQPTLLL